MSADVPSGIPRNGSGDSAPTPSPCAGCAHSGPAVDRRQFLTSASLLSMGGLLAACGDGVLSGPDAFPDFPATAVPLDPRTIPALQQDGGRVVVSQGVSSPVLVERINATTYRGLSLVCPHRGTIVEVQSGGFVCPNHRATFDLDGAWTGGQSTEDLAPVAVRRNADGTLTVGGTPSPAAVSLSAASATFSTTLTSTTPPANQTVAVVNAGGGALKGLQVSLAYTPNQRGGWLSVRLDSDSAPATLTLSAQRGTLPAGEYTATVSVTAPGATTGPQTIAVSLLVRDPASIPSIQLSNTDITFTAASTTIPAAQTVQVTNGGGGTLTGLSAAISYGPGATGWLSAVLGGFTAPTALTLRPTITGLTVGSYSATVVISGVDVAARSLNVTLRVTQGGLVVTIAQWPALATVGGVAGSVGTVNGLPVAVVRSGATSFAAFSMRCPHQGTVISVINAASFRCPNHGALFTATGQLAPNSPQQTDSLARFTVTYTPGAATFTVT